MSRARVFSSSCLLFIALLLLLSFVHVNAATYYLSATGNDSNNGLSPDLALLTFVQAQLVVPLGSDLSIGPGIFSFNLSAPTLFNLIGSGPDSTLLSFTGGNAGILSSALWPLTVQNLTISVELPNDLPAISCSGGGSLLSPITSVLSLLPGLPLDLGGLIANLTAVPANLTMIDVSISVANAKALSASFCHNLTMVGVTLTGNGNTSTAAISLDSTSSGFVFDSHFANLTGFATLLDVSSGGSAYLKRVTCDSVVTPGRSQCIYATGALEVEDSIFSNTGSLEALSQSGAILVAYGGSGIINRSTFAGNTALTGGAVTSYQANFVRITNSVFSGSYAASVGGAIYDYNSTFVYMNLNSFTDINAGYHGGVAAFELTNTVSIVRNSFLRYAGLNVTSGSGGGGLNMLNCQTVTVSNNIFQGKDSEVIAFQGGAIFAYNPSVSSALVHISQNVFSGNTVAYSGGAVLVASTTQVIVETCSFSGNTALGIAGTGGALTIFDVQDSVLYKNDFTLNTAVSAAGLELGASDKSKEYTANLTQNTFMQNTFAPGQKAFCSSLFTGLDDVLLQGNVFENTTLTPAQESFQAAEVCLGGVSSFQLLGNLISTSGDTSRPGLLLFDATGAIADDPLLSSVTQTPMISGVLLAGSNLTLQADLDLLDGGSLYGYYADTINPWGHFSNLDLNGHTISVQSGKPWFQSLNVYNGTMSMNESFAVFCCSDLNQVPDGASLDIAFYNAQLVLTGKSQLILASSYNNVFFDSTSSISLASGSAFYSQTFNGTALTVPSLIIDDSQFHASDLVLTGNLTAQNGASLNFYPAYWLHRNHSVTVSGTVSLDASAFIGVWPDEALPPFYPIVSGKSSYASFLSISNGALAANADFQSPGYIQYRFATEFDGSTTTTYSALPVKQQPIAYLDESLQALHLFIALPLNVTVPSDCQGFVDFFNNPGLDLASLQCSQQSSTHVIVTSASLPIPPVYINLTTTNKYVHTWEYAPNLPAIPVTPTALIQPMGSSVQCHYVALDGSHSSGVGSLPAKYIWTLENTTDSTNAPLLQTLFSLAPLGTASLEIPLEYITSGETYMFGLTVENWMGVQSSKAVVSWNPSNLTSLPPILLDGPSIRQYYRGVDLVLTGIVNATGCVWESNLLLFQWLAKVDGVETTLTLPTAHSPSLWVPASWFGTSQSEYTFTLMAYPATSGLIDASSNVSAIVRYGARPLSAVSTSRSAFLQSETISLTIDYVSYQDGLVNSTWTVITCPRPYLKRALNEYSAGSVASANSTSIGTVSTYDCISADGTPFVFPFNVNGIGNVWVAPRLLDPGFYEVNAHLANSGPGAESVDVVIPFTVYPATVTSIPNVVINLPSIDRHQASQKLVVSAMVDGFSGAAAEASFLFWWNVTAGNTSSTVSLNGLSAYVVPFDALLANQNIFISVVVQSKLQASYIGNATIEVPIASAPSGGVVSVYPSTGISTLTPFTVIAEKWSSRFWPLLYSFTYVRADGTEVGLQESSYQSRFSGTTIDSGESEVAIVQVVVKVVDGLGGVSVARVNLTLTPPLSGENAHEPDLTTMLSCMNASNWRSANGCLSKMNVTTLPDATRFRMINGMVTMATHAVAHIPANVATILGELNHNVRIVTVTNSTGFDLVADFLSGLVNSNTASFGTTTDFASTSSLQFVSTMANLLGSTQADWSISSDPIGLIYNHSRLVISSIVPGESPFVASGNGFSVQASQVSTTDATTLSFGIADSPVVEVDVSAVNGSVQNGYLATHFVHYAGTFPFLGENSGFREVVDFDIIGFDSSSSTSAKRVSSTFTRRATFNVTNTTSSDGPAPTPSCATYDQGTWTQDGCTTTSEGDSVSCSCTTRGPLTVLFVSSTPGGSSSSVWIPIVASVVPIAVVAVAILIFATATRTGRHIFTPFRDRSINPNRFKPIRKSM